MRFTKRRLDPIPARGLVLLSSVMFAGAAWSCASDDEAGGARDDERDASGDVMAPDAAAPPDSAADAPAAHDAGLIDAAPLPVVCASPSCVVSLVTSSSVDAISHNEGFCALMQDGTVACWGANGAGQLGRGDDAGDDDSATPARVLGLSNVISLHHTCAVDKEGAAYCWGTGPFEASGTASTTARTPVKLPIPAASHVDATPTTACAVTGDSVLCWGSNEDGQVGPFSTTDRKAMHEPRAVPLAHEAPIRDIAISKATFILHADGTIESWGANPPLARQSSLFPDPYPQPIAIGGISGIDLTDENACAVAGGIGYCWGRVLPNFTERDTDDLALAKILPEPVSTPEPIVQIATTMNVIKYELGAPIGQPQRWCAVGPTGDVYCWGANASGQAGDGTKDHAYNPVKVVGLPGPASQVKTTPDATCALLTTGRVYCWGSNYYGQLGNGKIRQPSLTPQEVVLP